MTKDHSKDKLRSASEAEKLSPSQFMRGLRPEYYSDTQDRAVYVLDTATLEFQLDSITQRNQTQDFEIFSRKLCERTICPNLRPQTGPEGGGDSKADTETYPVADELAIIYVGEPNAGRERWAFAFSAKKTWAAKVRSDVKGIIETGRTYNKIFCITSRAARSKDRARLEDELSAKYSVPVTIFDRSWIVKEVIEGDRKDLAFNYLHVGQAKSDSLRLGPTDYSRAQQLDDVEKSLDDPEAFRGMELQRVTEALVAARLSRNLERPRTETDGRFLRAIRLANAEGTSRQILEAQYEHLWTSFWWFDDIQILQDSYPAFESIALKSNRVDDLEFLSNLLQLFVNSVIHGLLARDACQLDERSATLRQALEQLAADQERPNNALEAQTLLLMMRVNRAIVDKKLKDLPTVWQEFSAVLDRAEGLGEYNADRLPPLIEVAGAVAGSDPAYNDLIEKLAKFVGARKSEAEGALILLKRAQKLEFSHRFDMIRLLGKAAMALTKREYAEHLIEALQLLALAYRSAGLLWAARATCIFATSSIVIEGEKDSQLPVSFVPTMKLWAWIAFELRHLPDLLLALQLLNGALAGLPLTIESQEKVREDLRELDMALGSLLLNLTDAELNHLAKLPDILEGLGLSVARAALLYTLGYASTLRKDGSLPSKETDEDVGRMFSRLASQPVGRDVNGSLILNSAGQQILRTTVLGMTIEINLDVSEQLTVVAEAALGTLEAFFATIIEQRISPHTEKFRINLVEGADETKPIFDVSDTGMSSTLTWPRTLSPTSFEQQDDIRQFHMEVAAHVLAKTCIVQDFNKLLEKLFANESALHRMAMVAVSGNSYHRLASKSISRLSDWATDARASYPLRLPRPDIAFVKLTDEEVDDNEDFEMVAGKPPQVKSHRAVSVRSVIDVAAWDQARWKGTLYAQYNEKSLPYMGFLFENEDGARRIFEGWRERFGTEDEKDEIYLAFIRRLPQENPHHYCVLITSNPKSNVGRPDRLMTVATRSMTMQPSNDVNIERFLNSYRSLHAFYLMPAILTAAGPPKLLAELAILKHGISVREAADIGEHDIESIALRMRTWERG